MRKIGPAVSVGDIDRDGKVDIFAAKSFVRLPEERTRGKIAAPALFFNKTNHKNHFINIRLRGSGGCNADAIGSRVYVKAGGVTQMREVYGGLGYNGHQNPLELHYGLGQNASIDEIRVVWADAQGTEDVFKSVKPDRFINIRKGQGISRR